MMILPISGVVHFGFQLAHNGYTYFSGLGFALLGVGTWQQSRIWRDSETLWRWGLEADSRRSVCANNLAVMLLNRPSRTPAEVVEPEALARQPMAVNPAYDSAHTRLGTILAAWQDDRGAEAAFIEAMRPAPERPGAAANLGAIYARNTRYAEALPLLRMAWGGQPDIPWGRANLRLVLRDQGIPLARSGRLAEAVTLFEEATRVTLDDADLHRNLGLVLWQQGRPDAAGPHLERAAALKPGDENTRGLLALSRAQFRPPASR